MQKVLNGIVAPHFILLWSFVLAEVPKDTALAEKTKGTHRVGRRRRPGKVKGTHRSARGPEKLKEHTALRAARKS